MRKAEEERLAAEALRRAEEERLAAEALRRAEEERIAAARKAEQERLAAEALRRAEEERLAIEAEQEKLAVEAAKKAEEERIAAEAARKAEAARLKAEETRLNDANAIKKLIENLDKYNNSPNTVESTKVNIPNLTKFIKQNGQLIDITLENEELFKQLLNDQLINTNKPSVQLNRLICKTYPNLTNKEKCNIYMQQKKIQDSKNPFSK